ncbi:hypothetical protein ACVWWG_001284 [Bradyrhizobium sp. LB7.2]|jgi:hypothetical protein|uniref:hypothetical protein n=1 Tax=unclassified Bradyrhizobium TaxID=2631580 RepID=UPI001FFBCF78|nr:MULTISPECIES: hypothetical protein [unclassified Bradyrhizobium]MCK1339389.1 hypothetical protein [Bradyrhizobium sp. 38]MCK1781204.1 hypothetical protein [Bradyrhizobium sp. 132]
MKSALAIIAVASLFVSFSLEVKAQTMPPASGAAKSKAPVAQPAKGAAAQKRMMTTCTPRQKMSGAACS